MRDGWRQRFKFLAFSLLPAVILFGTVEAGFRLLGLDEPLVRTRPLPGEAGGLLRLDPQFFWSLTPDRIQRYRGARVRINAQGLRHGTLEPRRPGELRILSLGESTTFGIGVGDDETYTARLGQHLARADASRRVTALNAGVPAWSSFQSLKFLERKGLALEPDLLLFYHEANDYLPSSLRDSSHNEIGVLLTDKQLYESRLQSLNRIMIGYSGIYRYFVRRRAHRQIRSFDGAEFEVPVHAIGMRETPVNSRLYVEASTFGPDAQINEVALGRRVSEAERREILEELIAITRSHGITLVLIHPSYAATQPHECLLTQVAAEHGTPLFDAHASLHPEGGAEAERFLDTMHPSAAGHARLAADLADFLVERGLLESRGVVARAAGVGPS